MKVNIHLRFLLKLLSFVILCGGTPSGWAGQDQPLSSSKSLRQLIQVSDLEHVLLKAIDRHLGRPQHQLSFHVLYPDKAIPVKSGTIRLEPEAVTGGRTGHRSFRVKIFVNQEFIQTVNVVGELKVKVEVPAPTKWMKAKDVLMESDLEFVNIEVPSLTHDFVLGLEEAVGKQVLRPLPPHSPIRSSALEPPPLIRKGDRVMIEVRSHGLLVQTVGMAKASGKPGETIPVQNFTSGREVLGMVLAVGVVEVPF